MYYNTLSSVDSIRIYPFGEESEEDRLPVQVHIVIYVTK